MSRLRREMTPYLFRLEYTNAGLDLKTPPPLGGPSRH